MAAQVNQMPAAPNASTQMPINAAGLSTRGAPNDQASGWLRGMAPRTQLTSEQGEPPTNERSEPAN